MLKPGTLRNIADYYLLKKDTADRIMPRAVKEFFDCKNNSDYEDALRILTEDIYAQGQFNEWLTFDFFMENEKSMIANFLVDNNRNLSVVEKKLYQKLIETNHYSLFEVLGIKHGVGLQVRDMDTSTTYEVSEYSATFDFNVGNIFYARLAQVDDRYEIVSADSKFMDVQFSERFRDTMRQNGQMEKKVGGTNKKLSPKDTYNFAKGGKTTVATVERINPLLAEKRMHDFLKKQGMLEYISVEKICAWIRREEDPLGSSALISIISSLGRNTLSDANMEELVTVISDLWNSHPHDSLAGQSPQDKRQDKISEKTDFVADIHFFGGSKCWDAADKAMKTLQQGTYYEALEKYKETFRLMLEEKVTLPDIYRLYANKGLAHLFSGEEIEGVRMLELALNLNPNYTFAAEQLNRYKSGEMEDAIRVGFLEAARQRLEDPDSLLQKWNPDSIDKKYSDQEIFDLLRSNGITLDKQSFMVLLKKYVDLDDLAKKELYPNYTGEHKNEDMVWASVRVLAKRLVPEAFYVDGLTDAILEADELIDKGRLTSKKALLHLATIKRYACFAPRELFTKWKTYGDYQHQTSLIVEITLTYLGTFKESEVIDMCEEFMEKTNDATFIIPRIYLLISRGDSQWTNWYKKLKNNIPYDPYAEVVISRAFGVLGDHKNTEKHIRLAVVSAEEGVKQKTKNGKKNKEELYTYTNLEYALDNLKDFLIDHKKKDESKIIDKRLSEVRFMIEDIEYKKIAKIKESFEREMEEKAARSLASDPAMIYFNYVRTIGIDYSTKEQVGINVPQRPLTEEKIGRNDLCPCGSGKKYKKCHGK